MHLGFFRDIYHPGIFQAMTAHYRHRPVYFKNISHRRYVGEKTHPSRRYEMTKSRAGAVSYFARIIKRCGFVLLLRAFKYSMFVEESILFAITFCQVAKKTWLKYKMDKFLLLCLAKNCTYGFNYITMKKN